MTFLFLGLLEKMLGKLRQRLRRKMRRDRVILQLRAELVPDLFVDRIDDFLACKHGKSFRLAILSLSPHRGLAQMTIRLQAKCPLWKAKAGIQFWRRPTLARPIAVLPSGLQRFTAVFGMGTGGATALLSPEVRAGLAVSALRA